MKLYFARALLVPTAVAVAMALGGCNPSDIPTNGRAMAPLSQNMLSEFNEKQMDKSSPILVRLFKEEAELEIWKKNRNGQFALLKTYPICRWSGDLGPKKKEGDRQAPEGFYTIAPGQMNPNSSYYLAFNTGFPNAYDRSHGYTGSELMVHGDCSSRGCYAMTDEQIQEIYALARESFFGGQKAFQLQAYPFRMNALNMAKHRNNPNFAFWKMLKEGYDHFEATKQEPKVAVCEKHYVFDAAASDNATKPLSFKPSGACPTYQLDKTIADAVLDHQRQEQFQMAQFIAQGVATVPPRTGDGGINPVFLAKLEKQDGYDDNGRATQIATAPGALPRIPNPPGTTLIAPKEPPVSQPVVLASVRVPEAAPLPKEGATSVSEDKNSIASLLHRLSGTSEEPAQPVQQVASVSSPSDTPAAAPAKPQREQRVASIAPVKHAKPHEAEKPKVIAHNVSHERKTAPETPADKASSSQQRTAFSAPTANQGGLLAGAQPVVPVGSFNNRWAGLQ